MTLTLHTQAYLNRHKTERQPLYILLTQNKEIVKRVQEELASNKSYPLKVLGEGDRLALFEST